jgi:ribosomal-protein-alanine N-acetyltransferase
MKIFETKRLNICHAQEKYFNDLLEIYNKPENMCFVSNGKHQWSKKELTQKYERFNTEYEIGIGIFVVEQKSTGKVIGEAGLFNSFQNLNKLELGYIIDSAYWRKGFGKEICDGLMAYAFEKLRADTLISRMYARNIASVKLSEQCGMRKTDVGLAPNGDRFLVYEKRRTSTRELSK